MAFTAFGRVVSMLSDRGATVYNWIALALEVVLAALPLLFAFASSPDPSRGARGRLPGVRQISRKAMTCACCGAGNRMLDGTRLLTGDAASSFRRYKKFQ